MADDPVGRVSLVFPIPQDFDIDMTEHNDVKVNETFYHINFSNPEDTKAFLKRPA